MTLKFVSYKLYVKIISRRKWEARPWPIFIFKNKFSEKRRGEGEAHFYLATYLFIYLWILLHTLWIHTAFDLHLSLLYLKYRNSSSFLLTHYWSTRPQNLEKIIHLLFSRFCSSVSNEGLSKFLHEFCLSKNDFALVKIVFFATHIQLI